MFDLFAALDASEEQLDFPILYGSAKQGWMATTPEGPQDAGMQPLFDLILRHVAPPMVEEGPFRMIGTILEANPYLGRIITGRITSGIDQAEPERQGAERRRQADRDRAASPKFSLSAASSARRWKRPKPATSSPSPA